MNPQKGRQHNHNKNYYEHVQPVRTARNKASRAARAKRRKLARGKMFEILNPGLKAEHYHLPHRHPNSPAAKARQLRRKERNSNKATIEKVFEHNKDTHITSFALIITQPEES